MTPEEFEQVRRGVRALIGVPIELADLCMAQDCVNPNDGTGSGYCGYDCYRESEGDE